MSQNHEHTDIPAQFLMENIELLPRGRALDIAMGAGRNAIYLARVGFEVDGVDISPEAVNAALESAKKAGVALKAQVADLEKGPHIKKESYDVIICFNYLQRSLIPEIKNGLRHGGMVVYETYIIDQAKFGKPKNPDYLLKHNELLDMFHEFRCLRYREGIFEGRRAIAGIVAQKVNPDATNLKTAGKYEDRSNKHEKSRYTRKCTGYNLFGSLAGWGRLYRG